MNITWAAAVVGGMLLFSGCASTPKHEMTKLQGSWVGKELSGPGGDCRMTVEGDTFKFQGARAGDWYVGTLTLDPKTQPKQAMVKIVDCPMPSYIGQTTKAIYKLEGKTLTIGAHEPGSADVPTTFDLSMDNQMREVTFTKQ